MARFFDWTPDDSPATIFRPSSDAQWGEIHDRYAGPNPSAQLLRVIELARERGATTVIAEHRYIDADYRSDHSAFYSTTFRRYPSVCDRLHFFSRDVQDDLLNLHSLTETYIGYSVMRPLREAPVGRTMMPPPPELEGRGTVCTVSEEVHLFDVAFTARGMPFISQDTQFLRCAHAAQWMVLRHSALRYGTTRWLTRDVQAAGTDGVVVGRQIPSEGLTVHQMLASLGRLGLSPGQLPLPGDRAASRGLGHRSLPAVMCRHVNSQMPPIVVSSEHAWVIVGYTVEALDPRLPGAEDVQHDRIVLFRHDDAMGPYVRIPDPWNEPEPAHAPWKVVLTPLQSKCYLTAERAELLARLWLGPFVENLVTNAATGSALDAADITYRTYAIPSWEFKRDVHRIVPSAVAQMYRLTHLPRFVWVVEAIDRQRLTTGDTAATIGEVLIDATSNHVAEPNDDAALIALHAAGFATSRSPDHETMTTVNDRAGFTPYPSGCQVAAV